MFSTTNRFLQILAATCWTLPAAAAPRTIPEAYIGTYELEEADSLICQSVMHGFVFEQNGSKQLELGPWFFPRIDLGPQTFEDDYSRTDYESWTTESDEIHYRSREVRSFDGSVSTSRQVATLRSGRLTVVSEGGFSTSGGNNGETYSRCVYRKVAE